MSSKQSVDMDLTTPVKSTKSDIKSTKVSKLPSTGPKENRKGNKTDNEVKVVQAIHERGSWGSNIEFLLASLGNMVGVGNVWRFPYLVYKNGGGVFLIPYVILMVLMAMPILLLDTIIGQYSQRGPVHAFRNMFPLFQGLGYATIITSGILSTSYNMLIGWVVFYMAECFSHKWTYCNNGTFNTNMCITIEDARRYPNVSAERSISTEEFFNYYVLNKSESIHQWSWPQPGLTISLFVVTAAVVLSLSKGIKSTGKVVYFTATFPYVMLVALFIRGITLEGAGKGISFYLTPDFSKLFEIGVWIDALIAVFFSLGVGMGCMIVYGSYNRFHNKLVRDVIIVILGDMLTSFFAGFVVFSMVGYVANLLQREVKDTVANGRALAFTVILSGLSTVPGSVIWTFLFFFGLFTLGIDSQFAFVETVTTYFYDKDMENGRKPNHLKVTVIYGIVLFLCSLPFATRAGIYYFDMYEYYSSGLPVMTVAIVECLLVGHLYGTQRLMDNLNYMTGVKVGSFLRKCLHYLYSYILPGLLFILLFTSFMALISDTFQGKIRDSASPWWAIVWGWSLTMVPIICIPIGCIYYLYTSHEKTFCAKVRSGITVQRHFHSSAEIAGSYEQNRVQLKQNTNISDDPLKFVFNF